MNTDESSKQIKTQAIGKAPGPKKPPKLPKSFISSTSTADKGTTIK